MVFEDMEAIKRFLMIKHNAGELNIDKLCVVGATNCSGVTNALCVRIRPFAQLLYSYIS